MTRVFEWVGFTGLAVLTNSHLRIPFEPVLIAYAGHSDITTATTFLSLGILGTWIGEALSLRAVPGRLLKKPPPPWLLRGRRRFYTCSALIAASPIPIVVARGAAAWRHASPLSFGLAVALGRAPRYALILTLWNRY